MEVLIYSISSFFALFSFYNVQKESEGRKKIQWLCIIILLVVNIFLFHYMIKCYEVPIHNNRISYFVSNCSKYRSFTGYSNIEIVYDYNTFKELKKTDYRGEPIEYKPGIEVSTYIKGNSDTINGHCLFSTSYAVSTNGVVYNNFDRWYDDGYKKLVKDISYISFLERDHVKPTGFEIDESNNALNVDGVLFMLEINSSNRQSFLPFKTWKDKSNTEFFEPSEFEYSILARNDSLAPHHDSVYYYHQWSYFKFYKPTINSSKIRDYRYMPDKDSILFQSIFLTRNNFRKPDLLTTAEDVSQAVEVLWIDNNKHGFNNNIKKIKYDYNGPVEFSDIYPEPDCKDISSLYYTDSLKIKTIEEKGLKFHVKFPDMENLQIIRMWIVTLLLGGFLGLLIKLVYNVFKGRIFDKLKSSIIKHKKAVVIITIVITVIAIAYIILMLMASHVDAFNLYDDRSFLIFET